MAEFDPATFEEEKYTEHFTELQESYKRAFERMNGRFDSQLIHAIDQQVLNESEPVYERAEPAADERAEEPREGEFRIELPENPYDRLSGVVVERERFETILEKYREALRDELAATFEPN